jgi:hypothetical protein
MAVRPAHVRRAFETFALDLAAAESVLSGIRDEKIKLPLRFANLRFDFDGDGKPESSLIDLFLSLRQERSFPFLDGNPDCLICFDRGDVAWLRAYCHLLSAFADFYLAFDFEPAFRAVAHDLFARPAGEKVGDLNEALLSLTVKHPERLGSLRRHLVAVCRLNRETWKFIRDEPDNDHEWLPNANQKGVIGLPVTDERIDAWLKMMHELEDFLEGRKVLDATLIQFVLPNTPGGRGGLSLKELLDNPPPSFSWKELEKKGVDPKYLVKAPPIDIGAFQPIFTVFSDPLAVAYAAWFN